MSANEQRSQAGFASIVIAIVLVLVLSLLTVGFAQLMRREQKSALDKHLSSEAYYAAESGINDAAKAINNGYTASKTTCGVNLDQPGGVISTQSGSNYLQHPVVSGTSTDGVSYPCLLINPLPNTLEFGAIDQVNSKVVYITGIDPTDTTGTTPVPIKYINISWQDVNGGTNFAPAGQTTFSPASGPGSWSADTGVLRISLTPLVSGLIDRTSMVNGTYAAFLYPNAGSGAACDATQTPVSNCPQYADALTASSDGTGTGAILDGKCNANARPRYCNVQISGLGSPNYLLDMRSIYGTSRVSVSAIGFNGSFLKIKNAQTVVDSTGKAADILRRVEVRIPSKNNYPHIDYDLQSMNGICKQVQLLTTSATPGCTP